MAIKLPQRGHHISFERVFFGSDIFLERLSFGVKKFWNEVILERGVLEGGSLGISYFWNANLVYTRR